MQTSSHTTTGLHAAVLFIKVVYKNQLALRTYNHCSVAKNE